MKNKFILTVLFVMLVSICAYSQPPGFDDNVEDVAPLPGIILAAIAGLYLGFKKLKSR